MRYLLDTNAFIAWLGQAETPIMRRVAANRHQLAFSAIVAHELYFGAYNSGRPEQNVARIAALDITLLPFDGEDARVAGEIRAELKRRGTPIGPFDVLIAGQALARDLVVVTANVREFERVEGLAIEDWTA